MAYTSTHTSHSILDRVSAFASDISARYAAYRVYRTTLTELQTLSNRELADLGLSPANLKSVAYEAAYKN